MQTILTRLHNQHLLRSRYQVTEKNQAFVIINRKQLINFCSNDYLGLTDHPAVKRAFAQGAALCGSGSGSSSLVSGFTRSHAKLEHAFADYLQRERALLFNSGYHANLGVISSLADRHSTIIADKYVHASLIDGIILSRAQHYRYLHNNMLHAAELAQKYPPSLLITENVFSMHGDVADIQTLALLSKQHHALLIVDNAHGFGVIDNTQNDIDCLITPLGKAAASFGAIVSGEQALMEVIMQRARTYRYSTALPPAICHASLQTLKMIQTDGWRRDKLAFLIRVFLQHAEKQQLPLLSTDATPIKSIIVGNNKKVLALQRKLLANGFFVACIRPPTIPAAQACLRISITVHHHEKQIITLIQLIKALMEQHAETH